MLIPYDNHHCLARAVDADCPNPKKHFGSKSEEVYGYDAVGTERVTFIFEGELDCLSVKVATAGKIHAVALGGSSASTEITLTPKTSRVFACFATTTTKTA